MIERVICPNQLTSESPIAEFTNGSTFKLVYHFYPINRIGAQLRLDSFQMSADYWIQGYEDNIMHFDKLPQSDETCLVDYEHSLIKFVFNNYQLNSGNLFVRFTFMIPDCELGYVKEVVEGFTGVTII